MDAPICKICRKRHYTYQPHMITDTVEATPAAVALLERVAELEERVDKLVKPEPEHKVRPPAEKKNRNDYMKGYMKTWRATQREKKAQAKLAKHDKVSE